MIEATAPGKLLLTGEYAVLEGAPAVALALGGPARARAEPAVAGEFQSAPGAENWPFSLGQGAGVHWHAGDPGEIGRLPAAVLAECLRRWPEPVQSQPLALQLDTSAFRALDAAGREQKYGLGSSAALVVALVGAVTAALSIAATPEEIRACCLDAHRAFQGGQGSGVDVLAALQGGLLLTESGAEPLALQWPADLYRVTVWTGNSASTPLLIDRFKAFRGREPAHFAARVAKLIEASRLASAAWRAGVSAHIMSAVQQYAVALRALDEQGQIGIWTPEHDTLAGLATDAGAVYKSSGAGGGDLGFALSGSRELAADVARQMTAAGFHVLPGDSGAQPGLVVTGGA